MSYRYSARNLLIEPHNYMYTPFEGSSLFTAFFAQRSQRLGKFAVNRVGGHPDAALAEASRLFIGRNLMASFPETYREWTRLLGAGVERIEPSGQRAPLSAQHLALREFSPDGAVATSGLMRVLVASMLRGTDDEDAGAWLDRLVQRFEVTKRLYETYASGFRKGSGDYKSLSRYWLLALALCLSLSQTESLRLLNTLLKVCDLLCSVELEGLNSELSGAGMRVVLATEGAMVRAVMQRKGLQHAVG